MGQTRSLCIGLALLPSQAIVAYAADLRLPSPPPEPCVGCAGPWYLKGFVGAANPDGAASTTSNRAELRIHS